MAENECMVSVLCTAYNHEKYIAQTLQCIVDQQTDFANLSSRISVYSVSDDYSGTTLTSPMIPDKNKHVISKPVHIGRHVIIGSTSVVLPGVTIPEGCAFGCFSFVNADTEAWSIYAGIPVHKINGRKKDLLALEQEFLTEEQKRLAEAMAAAGGNI